MRIRNLNKKTMNISRNDIFGRLLNIFIVVLILTILIPNIVAYADDVDIENDTDYSEIIDVSSKSGEEPNINSRAAIIYDRNSREIIYGKESNTKKKMASTTKIMTAIIVIENTNLSDKVTVSKKAAGTGGSRVGLKFGDNVSVKDLLYGLMLCSGNDAAVALAEYVGGSLDEFASLMNSKANELELKNTHFVTPHGLDNEDHYTTPYELAVITNYALNNKTFLDIVSTNSYTISINGRNKNISNTNELLGRVEGIYGVKTGFTNGANRCLVTAIKRENLDIIVVVLGADTKKFRSEDSVKLINYAFKNFEDIDVKQIIDNEFEKWKKNNEKSIYVNKGVENSIKTRLNKEESYYITIRKTQKEEIKVNINSVCLLEAPVQSNQLIGNLYIKVGDEEKLIINIVNENLIKKRGILDYMKLFLVKSI